MGGLHHSDLVILAGRPGMGKTALATNIAFAAAKRFLRGSRDGIEPEQSAGAAVAFFSLEMSADQLATRVLAERSGIPGEQISLRQDRAAGVPRFARAASELNSLPLYIDDTPALTIAALRARARRLKRQKGIGMIVVDYLQLLQGTGRNSNENRVQEISEISRGLKQLAKELHVPVLALSQLSRAVEQREDKRPQLSDLRESARSSRTPTSSCSSIARIIIWPPSSPPTTIPKPRSGRRKWSGPMARPRSSSPSSATARPARSSSSSTAASPSSAIWRTTPFCRRCAAREGAPVGAFGADEDAGCPPSSVLIRKRNGSFEQETARDRSRAVPDCGFSRA